MNFLTIRFYGEEDSDILKVVSADQDNKSVSKQEFEHKQSDSVFPALNTSKIIFTVDFLCARHFVITVFLSFNLLNIAMRQI